MAEPSRPGASDAEREVLRVLWEHGPETVREVQQRLASMKRITDGPNGYWRKGRGWRVPPGASLIAKSSSVSNVTWRAISRLGPGTPRMVIFVNSRNLRVL